jgi:hypothetical protein
LADRQARVTLVRSINEAFSAANIRQTVERLSPLRPGADFLDICYSLGLLTPLIRTNLQGYRRDLTMPGITRRIMTTAFRHAVLTPTPLQISIENGEAEAVKVTVKPDLIEVELIRAGPAVRERG